MPEGNCTALTEFILLGFTDRPEVEILLFGLFLLIYGTTVAGNVCLVVLVRLNARLHTPMYYFLSNLSFLDLSCSSAIAPKMLVNLLARHKAISSLGCGMLSRSDTRLNQVLLVALCGLIQTSTFLSIALSHTCILSTLSRIQVTDSRRKASHTCGSHLTAVGLFYGSLLFTYLKPSSSRSSLDTDKAVSALYTLVFPMLNPLIYSLRNKEVKDALRRTLERRVFSQEIS